MLRAARSPVTPDGAGMPSVRRKPRAPELLQHSVPATRLGGFCAEGETGLPPLSPMRLAAITLAAAALVAVLVIGLSQAGSQGGAPKKTKAPTGAAAQVALRGSPPPLASLHRQASDLLPGGDNAFDRRLAGLEGHPTVVNGWASWCGPCRFEFPFFQSVGVTYGKQVAFVGLDVTDNTGDARRFLGQFPVPYPSYQDD